MRSRASASSSAGCCCRPSGFRAAAARPHGARGAPCCSSCSRLCRRSSAGQTEGEVPRDVLEHRAVNGSPPRGCSCSPRATCGSSSACPFSCDRARLVVRAGRRRSWRSGSSATEPCRRTRAALRPRPRRAHRVVAGVRLAAVPGRRSRSRSPPASTARVVLVGGLIAFGIVFALNSSVHCYLILAYSDGDRVAMNVGFYYMANAGGRLAGTVLSGDPVPVAGPRGLPLGLGCLRPRHRPAVDRAAERAVSRSSGRRPHDLGVRGRTPGRRIRRWCGPRRSRSRAGRFQLFAWPAARHQDVVEHLRVAVEDVACSARAAAACRSRSISDRGPPSRMSAVSENSKSLRSPSTTTLALRVGGQDRRRRSRARRAPAGAAAPPSGRSAAGSGRTAAGRRPWS